VDSDEEYVLGRRITHTGLQPEELARLRFEDIAAYFAEPEPIRIAWRIHATAPNARIIVVVREQVSWLYSAYSYHVTHLAQPWRPRDFLDSYQGREYLKAGRFAEGRLSGGGSRREKPHLQGQPDSSGEDAHQQESTDCTGHRPALRASRTRSKAT